MSFYPSSPYGFGGMPPGYPRPMPMPMPTPTIQTQYSTATQYTVTQPFTGGGGMMPGYGQSMQFMPQGQMMMMPGQQFGQASPLIGGGQLGGGQIGLGGQQPIMLAQSPQLLYGGGQMSPLMGGSQFGLPGQQQILLTQQPQLYTGGQVSPLMGGSQFGGGQLGLQGLSAGGGGNKVPSVQQLGAQAFGQWPVGVFSPQAQL